MKVLHRYWPKFVNKWLVKVDVEAGEDFKTMEKNPKITQEEGVNGRKYKCVVGVLEANGWRCDGKLTMLGLWREYIVKVD